MRVSNFTFLVAVALTQVHPAVGAEPDPEVRDLLGAIDFVPGADLLDDIMGPSANEQLAEIAADPTADTGLRLRAIRALSNYPSAEAHDTLTGVVASMGGAQVGVDVLLLRAAIEALGEIGGPDDVPVITPYLEVGASPEACAGLRDVRAAAANALRVIGSPTAVPPLRARQVPGPDKEPCEQVSLAITEALRALLGGT